MADVKRKTRTALDNELREKSVIDLMEMYSAKGEEILRVGGNVIAFPTVDSDGNEAWVEITVKIPKGERLGKGEGFAGQGDFEVVLVVECFHAQGELGGDHAVFLAGENDFFGLLGRIGEIIRLIHFAELPKFLLLVRELLFAALQPLMGGLLLGLAASGSEVCMLLLGDLRGAACGCEAVRRGLHQRF